MKERLKSWFKEQIWENEQIVKLRGQFSELDPQTQSYTILGSFAAFVVILIGSLVFVFLSTTTVKGRIQTLEEQIRYVQTAAEKIEENKALARVQSFSPEFRDLDKSLPLASFAEKVAQKAMVNKESFTVTDSAAGAELSLNKISLRQLVRILYFLEFAKAGIGVEKLIVDLKDDTDGYLWAQLTLKKAPAKRGSK